MKVSKHTRNCSGTLAGCLNHTRTAVVAAGIVMIAMLPEAQALTGPEAEKVLTEAKILPINSCRAAVTAGKVTIRTYRHARATDDDLKIDSVLVAKKLMEKDPQLKGVSVFFYEQTGGSYRMIDVSPDQIKSFGEGRLSQPELLTQLSVKLGASPSAAKGPEGQAQTSKMPARQATTADPYLRKQVLNHLLSQLQHHPDANVGPLLRLKSEMEQRAAAKSDITSSLSRLEEATRAEFSRLGLPLPPILSGHGRQPESRGRGLPFGSDASSTDTGVQGRGRFGRGADRQSGDHYQGDQRQVDELGRSGSRGPGGQRGGPGGRWDTQEHEFPPHSGMHHGHPPPPGEEGFPH